MFFSYYNIFTYIILDKLDNVFQVFDILMNVVMVYELYKQLLQFVVDLIFHFDFDQHYLIHELTY